MNSPTVNTLFSALLVTAIVAASGCSGGVADDASVPDVAVIGPDGSVSDVIDDLPIIRPPLELEIGTGDRNFVPLRDGDPVNIILGPQGGYHIWTAVRMHHLDVPRVRSIVSVRLEATGALQATPLRVALTFTADSLGNGDYAGIYNFIDNPGPLRGQRVVLRVEATADDGRTALDERAVLAH